MKQPTLFDLEGGDARPADQAARDFAVDPAHDVVLEASAGTGKTRVLVDRYVRLIEAGVDPRHILAMTFTRKAAAEMRARVLADLHQRAADRRLSPAQWGRLRERLSDIEISTIDAFCFGLLREFPLEADVDPAFEIADETEMARFAAEAMDLTMRAVRAHLVDDESLRLLLARVKWPVLRDAVAGLLDRRHVALPAVARFVDRQRGPTTAAAAGAAFVARVRAVLDAAPERAALFGDGPAAAEFQWLHADLWDLATFPADDPARVQQLRRRIERYFRTREGKPRQRLSKPFTEQFASTEAKRRHERAVAAVAPGLDAALLALDVDVNVLLSRGLLRLLAVAAGIYERRLTAHALLDFAGMLDRSVSLLSRQEEFARSRLKLQARHHHLLVDEFQDTSRLQWRLIELLVDAWGEGEGVTDAPTSIFIVGDRKQSIYRFRHAEVRLLDEAARKIALLRPGRPVRHAITESFRAVPELLAFVNALSMEMRSPGEIDEQFTYGETDRFVVPPVSPGARRDGQPVLGLIAEPSMQASAEAVAAEVQRLLATAMVRDRDTGSRRAEPGDIAILFRARMGHQYFEQALEARGVRTYVYKGLGFFDAPEVQDLQALIRFLAQPESSLRAAEFLRSRFVRLSDPGLTALAPDLAGALRLPIDELDGRAAALGEIDRALLDRARHDLTRWLTLATRVTPSELVDQILHDTAYAFELRGRRRDQARENVKKVRALVRRVQSRGYATIGRIAEYFETLRAGDESNAIVEAAGAVSLMTIHAAKGLEFPIVFVVNVHVGGRARGTGFSLVERGPSDEPEVAFHPTDGTRLEDQRESEELRRLCYVAVTRARDRLYLAGEIDPKGRLRRKSRSLAGLFPPSLAESFSKAALGQAGEVVWASTHGEFAFSVCRPGPVDPTDVASTAPDPDQPPPGFPAVLQLVDRSRVHASAVPVSQGAPGDPQSGSDTPVTDRLLGTLVHRLFQRQVGPSTPDHEVAVVAGRLIRPEEAVDLTDVEQVAARAAQAFLGFRRRADIVDLLDGGTTYYEVPFSFVRPDQPELVVRGVMDCVRVDTDGEATLLEFKTGAPRPSHQVQMALYAEALAAVFGSRPVNLKILYP